MWDKYQISDKAFESYTGFEAGATSIRMSQGLLVPGLLQTESYARLITTSTQRRTGRFSVLLRLERQKEVFAKAPVQHHIMDEAVIRRQVGKAMPEQLRHLLELARKPEMTIQVIPFTAGPHFGCEALVLLGSTFPSTMCCIWRAHGEETSGSPSRIGSGHGGTTVDNAADEIASYEDGFESLTKIALSPAESLQLIEHVADSMS